MNQRSPWIHRLAIVPIPVLVLAIIALWVANVRVVWTSPTMTWLIHYGPVVLGMAVLASRAKGVPREVRQRQQRKRCAKISSAAQPPRR